MPSFGPAMKAVVKALKSPAIPEAVARGTAENPAILEAAAKNAPRITTISGEDVPFKGLPALETATRATYDPTRTAEEIVQGLKTQLGTLLERDPNLAKDVQQKLYRGRWRAEAAAKMADREIAEWHTPLTRAPAEQARDMYDFMYTADEVAQALRTGRSTIRALGNDKKLHDFPLADYQAQLEQLRPIIQNDPEIQETLAKVRAGLDQMFEDMNARGWQTPDHYLEDYTPIRRLNAVANGLASIGGESPETMRFRILEAMQHRGKTPIDARDVNLLDVLRGVRAEYYRKVAEHEAFLDIIADPTVNMTHKFSYGDEIPRGLAIYKPRPGMFGYNRKTAEGYMLDGLTDAIADESERIYRGGFIVPEALKESLDHFHPVSHTEQENFWYRIGSKAAKALTVYNPANTNVNRFSDPLIALLGLPGEKAHPLGFLKWYGTASKVAYSGTFGGKNTLVKIGNQTIDIWDLAVQEGITSGTIAHDLGAAGKLPNELIRLVPEAQRANESWLQKTKTWLESERLAVEATPRIAAGLEALERTQSTAEFGRIGREATLTYGSGAPRASTFPVIRAISPFLQFIGLASKRVIDSIAAKSTRGRMLAAILSVPVICMMWNTQNPEYEEAENSLKSYERNMLHIWLPDLTDPNKVRRDINGKPVALRFKYWVPEEVMRVVGLGNLPSRLRRVSIKRDTPKQFVQETLEQIPSNISDMLTMPQIAQEFAEGKTSTGRKTSWPERVARVLPITKIVTEGIAQGKDYGVQEGIKTAAEEYLGLRFANVSRRDLVLLDTQVREAKQRVKDAKIALKTAARNGPPHKVTEAGKELKDAVAELKRVAQVYKDEKAKLEAEGKTPERPKAEIDARKDAKVREAITKIKEERGK